jgi:hypothetical protein
MRAKLPAFLIPCSFRHFIIPRPTNISGAGLFYSRFIDTLTRLVYDNVESIDEKARSERFADLRDEP